MLNDAGRIELMRMNFTDDQIEELRIITEKKDGVPISTADARQIAFTLHELYEWTHDLIATGRVDHLLPLSNVDETLVDSA